MILRSSRLEVFCKKSVPIYKETLPQMFSCEFCEICKNTFSYRTPPVATSQFYTVLKFDVGRNQLTRKCKKKKKITEECQPECVPANKTDNSKFHVARNVEGINFEIELVRFHIVKLRYI